MAAPILTRAHLTGLQACSDGVALFDAHAVSGEIEYTAEIDSTLRSVNKGFRDWLVSKRLVPRYSAPTGDGYGYGSGSGSGYGDGDGYGSGYGSGEECPERAYKD